MRMMGGQWSAVGDASVVPGGPTFSSNGLPGGWTVHFLLPSREGGGVSFSSLIGLCLLQVLDSVALVLHLDPMRMWFAREDLGTNQDALLPFIGDLDKTGETSGVSNRNNCSSGNLLIRRS